MSRHDTGTKAFSFERVVWEIQRAFYSFKNTLQHRSYRKK